MKQPKANITGTPRQGGAVDGLRTDEARQSIPAQRIGQNDYQISLYPIHHVRKQLSKTEQSGLGKQVGLAPQPNPINPIN